MTTEPFASVSAGVKPWIYGFSLSLPVDVLWKRGYKVEEADRQGDAALLALGDKDKVQPEAGRDRASPCSRFRRADRIGWHGSRRGADHVSDLGARPSRP